MANKESEIRSSYGQAKDQLTKTGEKWIEVAEDRIAFELGARGSEGFRILEDGNITTVIFGHPACRGSERDLGGAC